MTSKVGDLIRKRREELQLDIEFCSSNLKIQERYLRGIENDDYSMFENSIQAQGFVQNYAELLGLNVVTLIPRWRKDVLDFFKNEETFSKNYYSPKKKRKINIVLTSEKIINFSFIILVIGFATYIAINYRNTVSSPLLEITNPENNSVVEDDLVDIFGKTDKDAELRINNEKITIQPDGNFATSIKLAEGFNTFKFTSINPYKKESTKILTIIYRPRKIEIYVPPKEDTLPSLESKTLPSSTTPEKKVN